MTYEREDILQFVKMLKYGLFTKGKDFIEVRSFAMDDYQKAPDVAAEQAEVRRSAVFVPGASF